MGVVNGINAFVPDHARPGRRGPRREHHVRQRRVHTDDQQRGLRHDQGRGHHLTECLWGQLREIDATVSASLLYPSTRTPGMLNTGIWRPGATVPSATTVPGAPPTGGPRRARRVPDAHGAAGLPVVFAPLSEVADLCFEGIRDDVFWITVPERARSRRRSGRGPSRRSRMTAPDYLLEANLMASKPTEHTADRASPSARSGRRSRSRTRSPTSTPPPCRPSCTGYGRPGRRRSSGAAGRGRSRRATGSPRSSGSGSCSRDSIGADADGIALVPATSYGFAVAARNLPLRAR